MKKKHLLSLLGLVIIVILARYFVIFSSNLNNYTEDDYRNAARKHYKIFSVYIPDNVFFAGEEIPIDKYYVRESLDRELLVNTYWHSHTFLFFKRAYRWFPIIEPILKKNNIPEDFKYLAVIESELTNAVSPAGAAGYWQFMSATAKSFGLEVSSEVDQRYDLRLATEAASDYLNQAYKKYGSWVTAAASYNAGYGTIDKAMQNQQVDNYYDLLLNSETSRYVYRIIAIKLIMEHPTEYGFYLRKKDLYPPLKFKVLEVDYAIPDLVEFAIEQGVNYRILKDYNPWLRKTKLSNPYGKKYKIYLPANEEAINYSYLQQDIHDDNRLFNDTLCIDEL